MSRVAVAFRDFLRCLSSQPEKVSKASCLYEAARTVSDHYLCISNREYSESSYCMDRFKGLDAYSRKFTSVQKEIASLEAPTACRLSTRGVIRVDGPDTLHFLQGLLTNDVLCFLRSPPPETHPMPALNQPATSYPPVYSALLSPQGRFLYDLFLYSPPPQDVFNSQQNSTGAMPSFGSPQTPELLVDVDADFADELVAHLNKYKLRANVAVQDVSADWSVWALFGGELASSPPPSQDAAAAGHIGWAASSNPAEQQTAEADSAGWSWQRDPRLPALGLRGLFRAAELPPLVNASIKRPEEYFRSFRYNLGVAEGSSEIKKGEALPLEYNLAALNAISFSKGCYVGQELTARTHHRGVVRKRVMPVTVDAACEEFQVNGNVHETTSGKSVGRIVAQAGSSGLALLRLSGALKGAGPLTLGSRGTSLHARRPAWWPEQWGREEDVL